MVKSYIVLRLKPKLHLINRMVALRWLLGQKQLEHLQEVEEVVQEVAEEVVQEVVVEEDLEVVVEVVDADSNLIN